MIKNVKNRDNPINTILGGDVCVPSAVLVKCRAMIIRVKEVSIMISIGAIAIMVSVIRILTGPAVVPFPLLYVIVRLLATLSSFKSSGLSDVPGSLILVLVSVSPVRFDTCSVAYTVVWSVINNMPTVTSRHNTVMNFLIPKNLFIISFQRLLLLFSVYDFFQNLPEPRRLVFSGSFKPQFFL